jgi:hypothetical protein
MTEEDIIRMAREARLAEHTHPYKLWSASDDGLERFAKLVAAAEREACAKVCENIDKEYDGEDVLATWCALLIRERGAP